MTKAFFSLSKHEPQAYLSLTENSPSPLISYKSHYSHKAPICPIKHELSPEIHPPKQFKGKFRQ